MELLERSLVRIFSQNTSSVIGAGFLISKRHILTCAHVVRAALGSTQETSMPSLPVKVQFPFLSSSNRLDAKVVLWSLPSEEGNDDMAVLEILQDAPPDVIPARLVDAEKAIPLDFKAYGFPEGYPNGIWALGVLRGKVATGRIQIEDYRQTGYFIESGFSGTAVWSDIFGGVMGMVVSADTDRSTRTAFMIPTQRLKEFIQDTIPEFNFVYHAPSPKKEKLSTNLVVVEDYSPHLYVASATTKRLQDIWDAHRKHGFSSEEWLLKGGNITSFHNLDEDQWSSVCDQGTVEQFDTDEWADSTDVDRQRDFVFLLNKCLKSKVRADLQYNKSKDYYYFRSTENLKLRVYSYYTGKQRAGRRVFAPYGKSTDDNPYYYRHSAFSGHFRRYEDQWYLEITPTYHFTIDGSELHPKYEDFVKKIKQLERNQAVMGQVRMWAYYLAQPPDMLTPKYPFLSFGELLTLDADFGLNDEEWLSHEEDTNTTSQAADDTPLL